MLCNSKYHDSLPCCNKYKTFNLIKNNILITYIYNHIINYCNHFLKISIDQIINIKELLKYR